MGSAFSLLLSHGRGTFVGGLDRRRACFGATLRRNRKKSFPVTKWELVKHLDSDMPVEEREETLHSLGLAYVKEVKKFANRGHWREAIASFRQLDLNRILKDERHYSALANAYCEKQNMWEQTLSIVQMLLDHDREPELLTRNLLIRSCRRVHQWKVALEIQGAFDKKGMVRNKDTYKELLMNCRMGGLWEEAIYWLEEMQKNRYFRHDFTLAWNLAVDACQMAGEEEAAEELMDEMEMEGIDLRADIGTKDLKMPMYRRRMRLQ